MFEMHPKQKSVQELRRWCRAILLCGLLCGFGTFASSASSQAQTMAIGSSEQKSTLRLVAVSGLKDGRYEAGVDLTMMPGSHTYWKMPGEAGVPPVFTFDGDNVRQADVSYPVPSRIIEEGIDAFGYTGQVVFPVAVTPADASKPSTLHVDVTYAICNRICLPGHSEATLQLKPDGTGTAPELVEAALARVPRPVAEAAAELRVSRERNVTQPTWTLTWTGTTPLDDIFSDAPEGFYFLTKKTAPNTWTLTADQSVPATNVHSVPVSLVLASGGSAIETKQTFDIGPVGK